MKNSNFKNTLLRGEKIYTFTTRNSFKEDVETYRIEAFNLNDAKKYARSVVGNSRDNEVSHGKITLVK